MLYVEMTNAEDAKQIYPMSIGNWYESRFTTQINTEPESSFNSTMSNFSS